MERVVTRHSYEIDSVLQDVIMRLEAITGIKGHTKRLKAANAQSENMLIVEIPSGIEQRGVYQSTTLAIEVIVKDKSQGVTNIPRLTELTNLIQNSFPLKAEDNRYKTGVPYLILEGSDTMGFTIWRLQCPLFINKSDTYNFH